MRSENHPVVTHAFATDSAVNDWAVQKTLGWMQVVFELLGMLITLAALVLVVIGIEDKKPLFMLLCALGGICFLAGSGIRLRNRRGYVAALCGTLALLMGVPLLTMVGAFFLLRLLQPQMRAAFGWQSGGNASLHGQNGER